MFITFTPKGESDANHSYGLRFSVVVADRDAGPRALFGARKARLLAPSLLCRRCADVQQGSRSGSLGPQDGPLAIENGKGPRPNGPPPRRRRMVRLVVERKPRL